MIIEAWRRLSVLASAGEMYVDMVCKGPFCLVSTAVPSVVMSGTTHGHDGLNAVGV